MTRPILRAFLVATVTALFFSVSATAVNGAAPTATLPALIPWPKSVKPGSGTYAFASTGRIAVNDALLKPLGEVLSQELFMLTGHRPEVAIDQPRTGDVALQLLPTLKGLSQRVEITTAKAVAQGGTYDAVAMASVTLLQAMTVQNGNATLPQMVVDDEPGSVYCGTMVDVARQWHPAEALKPIIQMCRLYKIHYLHLHLTDNQLFTFPSTALPNLATPQHYTLDELKDLVAYGDARGVVLVPEIEMPGHTRLDEAMPEIFGAPDASGKPVALGVLNITSEAIYPPLQTLIGEVCDVFASSPYFHIGCDETNWTAFDANPSVQQQKEKLGKDTGALFAEFINRINAVVKARGKQTIVWEGFGEGSKVDKDVIVMAWHGSSNPPKSLLDAGYRIINVPWVPSIYNSTRENYEWNIWRLNLSEAGNSDQFDPTASVLGGQMVLWEKAPNDALPLLRLKAPARLERVYAPHAKRTFADFAARLQVTDALLDRLLFPIRIEPEGLVNADELNFAKSAQVKLSTSMSGVTVRYEINAAAPTAASPAYTDPISVTDERAQQVYLSSYYGKQVAISAQAFDADGKPVGAVSTVTLRNDAPRFKYTLYRSATDKPFTTMPDFNKLKAFESGVLGRAESASKIKRATSNFAMLMAAQFEAEGDGEYGFSLEATPAAELRMDDKVVCAVKPGEAKQAAGTVKLTKGIHAMQIAYYTNDGQVQLNVPIEQFPTRTKHHWEDRGLYEWLLPLNGQ